VTPAARRDAVRRARLLGMSERRACGLIGIRRSTCRRKPRRGDAPGLREAPLRPAEERPRVGRRRLHVLLRRELAGINNKRVYRIYRREGLAVRRKQRKRLAREPRAPMPPVSRPNECWSMDFTQDALESGRAFRTLNVVDVVTRMCLAIEVDTSLPAARVVRVLDRPAAAHGRPGTPTDTPFESLDDKFRDERLNQHWFGGLVDERFTIENWRIDHNLNRPHNSLGNLPPASSRRKLQRTSGRLRLPPAR